MSDEQANSGDGTETEATAAETVPEQQAAEPEQAPGTTPGQEQAEPARSTVAAPPRPVPGPPPAPRAPLPGPPPGGRPRPVPPPRPPAAPAAEASPAEAAAAEPVPVAAVPAVQTIAVPEASADPGRWGRVDDEGRVFLVTSSGEREVGSWQAGAPQEGLAHFARRFDDLRTEAELLTNRLAAGGGDPKQALHSATALRDSLPEAAVVGDVASLSAHVAQLVTVAEEHVGAARSARSAQREAAVARKEALAAEAEALAADATQWKQAGDRFKAILDEWRTIKGIDRRTDEALWKRYSRAREAFNRRRGSHFADLDRQRATAKARKEELAAEAEQLVESTEWGPTAARYRELMAEWKAAGRAQKDADDALWQRFRGAQDQFFSRRTQVFSERDAEFGANAEAKRALLAEAEKIDTDDADSARAALRDIQERWETIGKVPRDDIRPLESALRAVEERVREAVDRQWRRTDPEAEARVAQFRDRVAQFESQAEKAEAAGDAKRARQAREQADQWREWLKTAEESVNQR
ncbi:hypothetical protein PSU4_51820 [Pseudonocardia sulfidoxydans NBRC 16205]|uniref:DNA repair ATPase n=1 Tax=Pseudonocardia sulfidoxydans NBRC 16205 TaxID=1223511 RepID=A0A511DT30_9PSEU|nr:hypothetical protein PSU4_51820 [Pseudonocardia sulfidoxydans NBRC 16205]